MGEPTSIFLKFASISNCVVSSNIFLKIPVHLLLLFLPYFPLALFHDTNERRVKKKNKRINTELMQKEQQRLHESYQLVDCSLGENEVISDDNSN